MPPAPFSTSPLTGVDLGQILTDFLNERQRRKLLAESGGGLPQEIFLDFYSFDPLSPSINIQILQTDLHTFPTRISWENLIIDQGIFSSVIILFILITYRS